MVAAGRETNANRHAKSHLAAVQIFRRQPFPQHFFNKYLVVSPRNLYFSGRLAATR